MAFILAATLACYGQNVSTGSAKTSGSCSPAVTGSGNTINIKTCGMTDEQVSEFRNLLQQILASQANAEDLIRVLRELNSGQIRIENGVLRIEESSRDRGGDVDTRLINSESILRGVAQNIAKGCPWPADPKLQQLLDSTHNTFQRNPADGLTISGSVTTQTGKQK